MSDVVGGSRVSMHGEQASVPETGSHKQEPELQVDLTKPKCASQLISIYEQGQMPLQSSVLEEWEGGHHFDNEEKMELDNAHGIQSGIDDSPGKPVKYIIASFEDDKESKLETEQNDDMTLEFSEYVCGSKEIQFTESGNVIVEQNFIEATTPSSTGDANSTHDIYLDEPMGVPAPDMPAELDIVVECTENDGYYRDDEYGLDTNNMDTYHNENDMQFNLEQTIDAHFVEDKLETDQLQESTPYVMASVDTIEDSDCVGTGFHDLTGGVGEPDILISERVLEETELVSKPLFEIEKQIDDIDQKEETHTIDKQDVTSDNIKEVDIDDLVEMVYVNDLNLTSATEGLQANIDEHHKLGDNLLTEITSDPDQPTEFKHIELTEPMKIVVNQESQQEHIEHVEKIEQREKVIILQPQQETRVLSKQERDEIDMDVEVILEDTSTSDVELHTDELERADIEVGSVFHDYEKDSGNVKGEQFEKNIIEEPPQDTFHLCKWKQDEIDCSDVEIHKNEHKEYIDACVRSHDHRGKSENYEDIEEDEYDEQLSVKSIEPCRSTETEAEPLEPVTLHDVEIDQRLEHGIEQIVTETIEHNIISASILTMADSDGKQVLEDTMARNIGTSVTKQSVVVEERPIVDIINLEFDPPTDILPQNECLPEYMEISDATKAQKPFECDVCESETEEQQISDYAYEENVTKESDLIEEGLEFDQATENIHEDDIEHEMNETDHDRINLNPEMESLNIGHIKEVESEVIELNDECEFAAIQSEDNGQVEYTDSIDVSAMENVQENNHFEGEPDDNKLIYEPPQKPSEIIFEEQPSQIYSPAEYELENQTNASVSVCDIGQEYSQIIETNLQAAGLVKTLLPYEIDSIVDECKNNDSVEENVTETIMEEDNGMFTLCHQENNPIEFDKYMTTDGERSIDLEQTCSIQPSDSNDTSSEIPISAKISEVSLSKEKLIFDQDSHDEVQQYDYEIIKKQIVPDAFQKRSMDVHVKDADPLINLLQQSVDSSSSSEDEAKEHMVQVTQGDNDNTHLFDTGEENMHQEIHKTGFPCSTELVMELGNIEQMKFYDNVQSEDSEENQKEKIEIDNAPCDALEEDHFEDKIPEQYNLLEQGSNLIIENIHDERASKETCPLVEEEYDEHVDPVISRELNEIDLLVDNDATIIMLSEPAEIDLTDFQQVDVDLTDVNEPAEIDIIEDCDIETTVVTEEHLQSNEMFTILTNEKAEIDLVEEKQLEEINITQVEIDLIEDNILLEIDSVTPSEPAEIDLVDEIEYPVVQQKNIADDISKGEKDTLVEINETENSIVEEQYSEEVHLDFPVQAATTFECTEPYSQNYTMRTEEMPCSNSDKEFGDAKIKDVSSSECGKHDIEIKLIDDLITSEEKDFIVQEGLEIEHAFTNECTEEYRERVSSLDDTLQNSQISFVEEDKSNDHILGDENSKVYISADSELGLIEENLNIMSIDENQVICENAELSVDRDKIGVIDVGVKYAGECAIQQYFEDSKLVSNEECLFLDGNTDFNEYKIIQDSCEEDIEESIISYEMHGKKIVETKCHESAEDKVQEDVITPEDKELMLADSTLPIETFLVNQTIEELQTVESEINFISEEVPIKNIDKESMDGISPQQSSDIYSKQTEGDSNRFSQAASDGDEKCDLEKQVSSPSEIDKQVCSTDTESDVSISEAKCDTESMEKHSLCNNDFISDSEDEMPMIENMETYEYNESHQCNQENVSFSLSTPVIEIDILHKDNDNLETETVLLNTAVQNELHDDIQSIGSDLNQNAEMEDILDGNESQPEVEDLSENDQNTVQSLAQLSMEIAKSNEDLCIEDKSSNIQVCQTDIEYAQHTIVENVYESNSSIAEQESEPLAIETYLNIDLYAPCTSVQHTSPLSEEVESIDWNDQNAITGHEAHEHEVVNPHNNTPIVPIIVEEAIPEFNNVQRPLSPTECSLEPEAEGRISEDISQQIYIEQTIQASRFSTDDDIDPQRPPSPSDYELVVLDETTPELECPEAPHPGI